MFVPVKDCGAKLSGTVRDVPGPERIIDDVNAERLLSYLLSSFPSPSAVEADAARAFLSSRRSALCVRLSLSSFESPAVNISTCRKGRPGKGRFSTNCHQAPDRAVATGREESESERVCETTPFVFSNKPVYAAHSNLRFDMIRSVQCSHIRSTTISLIYRVPAAFVPRGNDQPASSLLQR